MIASLAHQMEPTELIFHRGAKVKDTRGFEFNDTTGLLKWAAADRAVVTFQDMKDLQSKKAALVKVVGAWIEATT